MPHLYPSLVNDPGEVPRPNGVPRPVDPRSPTPALGRAGLQWTAATARNLPRRILGARQLVRPGWNPRQRLAEPQLDAWPYRQTPARTADRSLISKLSLDPPRGADG